MLTTLRTLGPGYDYGNARTRAMAADLIDDYEPLLGLDLDGVLAVLAEGPYEPEVRAATRRYRGMAALQATVGAHLARRLRTLRGCYGDSPAAALDLLLLRWDVRNTITLLRGQARRATVEQVLPLLVTVGAVDESVAETLASCRGVRELVVAMRERGLPTPALARAMAAAAPAYDRTGDLAAVEHALARAEGARLATGIDALDLDDADVVGPLLRADLDRRNLLLALRLRADAGPPDTARPDRFLPGGGVPLDRWVAAARALRPADVTAELEQVLRAEWRAPLAAWARDGDLTALDRDTEAASTRRAMSLLWRADALGIGVPAGYVAAVENEARNLRLLGHAACGSIPVALVRPLLVGR